MFIFRSMVFVSILVGLVLSALIGYAINPILGVAAFFVYLWNMGKWPFLMDIGQLTFEEHHRRSDERAKKILDSIRILLEKQAIDEALRQQQYLEYLKKIQNKDKEK